MKANSDKMHDKYKDYDFADAKPVVETPHLAKLQAETGGNPGLPCECMGNMPDNAFNRSQEKTPRRLAPEPIPTIPKDIT